jgi:hypothetical protein
LRTNAAEAYLYLLERQPDVVDIRELFPILDLPATLKLCAKLEIQHELRGVAQEPFLIDFLITRQVGNQLVYSARSLETATGPVPGRRLEEFRLQYAWCKAVKIDWKPVNVSGLTPTVIESLDFIRGWHREMYVPEREAIELFSQTFERVYRLGSTLSELMEDVSSRTGESVERCRNHFRYAGWARFIDVDLRYGLALNKPVKLHAAPEA